MYLVFSLYKNYSFLYKFPVLGIFGDVYPITIKKENVCGKGY
ncbi:hypothetical protein PCIT_a3377 [Pseudoalteromonas citrea]|uniref:Uncharacterized protein n=1 Tax=Pseudoalteromonas citrea TaxID=43655 RepID=A0AAD4AH09_9GAMM|nr:hypothetical protein PCIT_a3377 [Pseudoalteromonas citrea]